ncbi:DUF5017 domain-containing protein [Gaoshiqia sp. Z1-71]|uniref:DUF5017 domain-containing protein n=1 Tax=Gaoshiqia hydrogeniformans TaxID=3290090 RepID=UPI003BF80F9C
MKFKYYHMIIGLLVMASCEREIEVDMPDFDVTTNSATYQVGEEITFDIKGGDAHIISFYSGETLKDYAFKEGRVVNVSGAGATMQFQSSVQSGTQANQLSVMASSDFNGDYSSVETVKAATWTDITTRFLLGTNATFKASGNVDISDLMVDDEPIFIAFKYVTQPQEINGLARQWFIQSFVVTSIATLDGSVALNLTDQVGAGFRIIDENKENAPARASVTNTRVTLYGNEYYSPSHPKYVPDSPYNDPLSEHWAVSKPINTTEVDLGPDWATAIKGLSNPEVHVYRYTYTKTGTYKAVFVASNNSIDDEKKIIREITLTITE